MILLSLKYSATVVEIWDSAKTLIPFTNLWKPAHMRRREILGAAQKETYYLNSRALLLDGVSITLLKST